MTPPRATSLHAVPSAQLPTRREADLPSSSCRGALGETARHPLAPALMFSVCSSELESVESRVFEAPAPPRHPLESITPAGLVLLALLSASVGLVLAVLLKLLSMALSFH